MGARRGDGTGAAGAREALRDVNLVGLLLLLLRGGEERGDRVASYVGVRGFVGGVDGGAVDAIRLQLLVPKVLGAPLLVAADEHAGQHHVGCVDLAQHLGLVLERDVLDERQKVERVLGRQRLEAARHHRHAAGHPTEAAVAEGAEEELEGSPLARLESSVQRCLPRRRRVECEAAVDFEERLEDGGVVAVLDDELEERDARPRVARVDDGRVAVGDETQRSEQLFLRVHHRHDERREHGERRLVLPRELRAAFAVHRRAPSVGVGERVGGHPHIVHHFLHRKFQHLLPLVQRIHDEGRALAAERHTHVVLFDQR